MKIAEILIPVLIIFYALILVLIVGHMFINWLSEPPKTKEDKDL